MLADLRRPEMRKQFGEFPNGMRWDTREHIAKPGEGVQFVEFARAHKATHDGHGLSAAVATEEGQVVMADGDAAPGLPGRRDMARSWVLVQRKA